MCLDLNSACQKYFTQALKSDSFKTSQLRLLAEELCQNEHAKAM